MDQDSDDSSKNEDTPEQLNSKERVKRRRRTLLKPSTLFLYGVADGFAEDCHALVNAFLLKDSIRFTAFLAEWKESKFELVFSGRRSLSEYSEFCNEAMKTAMTYFSEQKADDNIQVRVAGLYLIYAIHHMDAISKKAVVRVLPSSARVFTQLRAFAVAFDHFDVLYVLSSLLRDGVFRFVATPREYGLEESYWKYFTQEFIQVPNAKRPRLDFREEHESDSNDIFAKLKNALDTYHSLKCSLLGNRGNKPPKELNYVDRELPRKMIESFDKLSKSYEGIVKKFEQNHVETTLKRHKASRANQSVASLFECMNKKSPVKEEALDDDAEDEFAT